MKKTCIHPSWLRSLFARLAVGVKLSALLSVALLAVGCANPTAVSRETSFQPNEGAAVFRLINISDVNVGSIEVTAEGSKEVFTLSSTQFGQTGSTMFIGRLPAGRYQPTALYGSGVMVGVKAPLQKLTGKFDVEASRITDLRTIIYLPDANDTPPLPGEKNNRGETRFRFSLPLDPTPVPTEQLLATRFPLIAAGVNGRSNLGWVAGTVPQQPPRLLDQVSRRAATRGTPIFLGEGRTVTAGWLGTVVERGAVPYSWAAQNTGGVQQLEAIIRLKDGRWMVGGEEGYLAIAGNLQTRWSRLPGPAPDEVVFSLLQGPDGSIYMLTMNDAGSTVYQSAPDAISWKVIRRIGGDRSKMGFENASRLRNSAAMSNERLVINTLPNTITSLDLRTGQWESHEAARPFLAGIKITPDGYLTGLLSAATTYGSEDHGKTWHRQEWWTSGSLSDYSERNKGIMISANTGLVIGKYFVRKTEDGGKTWSALHESEGISWNEVPLWIDPFDKSGKRLYAIRLGRVYNSTDMGATWN